MITLHPEKCIPFVYILYYPLHYAASVTYGTYQFLISLGNVKSGNTGWNIHHSMSYCTYRRSGWYVKYSYCNAVDRIQHGLVTAIPISVSITRWEDNTFYIWKQNAGHILTKDSYLCHEWWSVNSVYVDALAFSTLSWHQTATVLSDT